MFAGANGIERGPVFREPTLPSHGLDQELQPVALFVLVVAESREHPQHGVCDVEQLVRRQKFMEQRSRATENRGASGHGHLKSERAVRRDRRTESEIVDARSDVVVGAAFEANFELPRHRIRQGFIQKCVSDALRVRIHVEDFVTLQSRRWARRHVSDRVVARFTRRETLLTMAGVLLVMLLASLDQTIVGTAMPHIITELQGFDRYAWVTTAYLLTSTVMVPIYGKLSDIFGRKPIFLIGVVLFLVGSAASGASQTMNQLIAFRAFQGLGAAALMPIAIAVIEICSHHANAASGRECSAAYGAWLR